MGRAPCCEKVGLKRGRWTTEEDDILTKYIQAHGEGSWRSLPKNAGLLRCGKSCRLRWINYLRSDLRRGNISSEEEETIIKLHASMGNRWSLIASNLPGRTDNEIKNYWNSHLSKKIDSVPSSNQTQQQEQTDAIDLPKPQGNTIIANKSIASRTERPAMKKKKNKSSNISATICDPPLVPKLLEKAKESVVVSEFENGNGIVPMPATPTMEEETMNIGSMLLESNEEDKEIMSGICLDSSCFNDMVLNNIDGSLEDLEVDPNGVLANTVSSEPILEEGNKMAMLMSDQEDLEINLRSSNGGEINGEWYSCNSSTNSYRMNEEEEKLGWDYWDLDGGVQNGQELWDSIEEEKTLSWLWDTTTTTTENDEGECTSNKVESAIDWGKQNAMVAWLLS